MIKHKTLQKIIKRLVRLIFFDKDLRCVYRGQLDDSSPSNKTPVTGKALRAALDNILMGKPVASEQKPSIGCDIKWKS